MMGIDLRVGHIKTVSLKAHKGQQGPVRQAEAIAAIIAVAGELAWSQYRCLRGRGNFLPYSVAAAARSSQHLLH